MWESCRSSGSWEAEQGLWLKLACSQALEHCPLAMWPRASHGDSLIQPVVLLASVVRAALWVPYSTGLDRVVCESTQC